MWALCVGVLVCVVVCVPVCVLEGAFYKKLAISHTAGAGKFEANL